MSSRYWDRDDNRAQKSGLNKLLDSALALAWISVVGSVTYTVLMFTDILPEEMRLAALDQMLNPGQQEADDPEETLKVAGLDPESLAVLAMAATTMGQTKVGLAATDLIDEYDEEAFELMQEMELKSGDEDYLAMISQLPDDVIDTELSEAEAMAELAAHSAAMAEMQGLMAEAGAYQGPIDGLNESGDIENVVGMMDDVVGSAVTKPSEGSGEGMGAVMEETLKAAGYLDDDSAMVKSMTDRALQTVLDEQRFTVPMLDTETSDLKKIKAYKDLIRDPDTMLSGETDTSVRFIGSYMLPHTLLSDAVAYREAGETDRALNALRLIFLAFPEHPMTGDALLLLSDIQDSQGETDASRRSLRTFLTVHGGHPRIVDGVIRYGDWKIASGEGLPAACRWLWHVSAYPPAIHDRGLSAIHRAAQLRGCHDMGAPAEFASL